MAVNGIKTLQDFTMNVSKESKEAISGVYRPKGSVYFANLPALTKERIGFVYDVKDAFTTTSDFVEGSGKSYPIGTNVVIIEDENNNLKYDCLAGIVVQESGLPAVTSSDNGKILKVINGEWDKANNNNGYVQVVGDGIKSVSVLLGELNALIDYLKLTYNSKVVAFGKVFSVVKLINDGITNMIQLTYTSAYRSLYMDTITIDGTAPSFRSSGQSDNGYEHTDGSADAVPDGVKIVLYY